MRAVEPVAARNTPLSELPAHLPRVLSFGGGVNSWALLLRLVRMGLEPDAVVFADTGEERGRTLAYIEEHVAPFCKKHGIRFEVVTAGRGALFDYYLQRGAVPSTRFRDCTYKFKVQPVRAFVKRELGATAKRPVVMLLGIDAGEPLRARDSNRRFIINAHPLMEWGMDRAACEAEIAAAGYPSPGKSGCVGCVFSTRRELWGLHRQDPAAFERLAAVEDKALLRNPRFTLLPNGPRLRDLAKMQEHELPPEKKPRGECLGGDACAPDTEED